MSGVQFPPTPQKILADTAGIFFVKLIEMYTVYLLYSLGSKKTYCGFTNNMPRRLEEHNVTESKGFTLKYRPWTLIHTEIYENKKDAMSREKQLKSGQGREEIKRIVNAYLNKTSTHEG